MKRREFLAMAGGLALAGCGGAGTGEDGPSGGQPGGSAGSGTQAAALPVIVIGAGIAGLATARQLVDAGKKVVVLEARNRLGGRIHTSTKWADVPLDLGATWIHGDGAANPLTGLAQKAAARTTTTSFARDAAYDADGHVLTNAEQATMNRLRSEMRAAVTAFQESSSDVPLRDAIYRGVDYANKVPFEQRLTDHLINTTYEHEYSGPATELSALNFDSDSRFNGDERLFLDGYSVLSNYLAKGLDVRLQQIVREINYSNETVTVSTSQGTVQGTAVVVTVPLGVLQSGAIQFSPALPTDKLNAINGLGMGTLNKCYLRFPTAFWDTAADWINYVPAATNRGEWAEWLSLTRVTGKPVLLGFNAADYGRSLEKLSDSEIVARAMQTLRAMYGNAISAPLDWQITRWMSDPFARGAYSFNKTGAPAGARTTLAAPLSRRLYFAGEATDARYFQSVHGAYLSGLRAANEVLNQKTTT